MDIQKFMAFYNQSDPFKNACNIQVLEMGQGHSKIQMDMEEKLLNFMGTLHGGALFTLADVAAGTSITYHNRRCVTLNSNINFIKSPAFGKITAYGREISLDGNIANCEIEIYDHTETLVGKAEFTMFVMEQPLSES